jgi:predicted GNAT family N-acyltransferase
MSFSEGKPHTGFSNTLQFNFRQSSRTSFHREVIFVFNYMNLQIFQIEFGTPEYDEAVQLRYQVLRAPLGLEYLPEQLAAEYDQIHLAAYDMQGTLLAYLNLTPADTSTVKMRQVAVSPAYQGRGIGTLLVAESEQVALKLQFTLMSLHAREPAVPFYERLGYKRVGERFEEVTVPHFKMEKKLI